MYTRYSLLVLVAQAIGGALSGSASDRKVPLRPGLVRDGEAGAIVPDFAVSPRNLFDVSSPVKRQGCPSSCTSGFCCSDGTCVTSRTDRCCDGGFVCTASQQCCHDGCIGATDECCRSGGYCESGTLCYLVRNEPKCCRNADCDGDLDDPEGATSARTTARTTSRSTSSLDLFPTSFSIPTSLTAGLSFPTPTSGGFNFDIPDVPGGAQLGLGVAGYPYPVEGPAEAPPDLSDIDLSNLRAGADSLLYNAFRSWRMILLSTLAAAPVLLAIFL